MMRAGGRHRSKGPPGAEKGLAKRRRMVHHYSLPERFGGASKWGV